MTPYDHDHDIVDQPHRALVERPRPASATFEGGTHGGPTDGHRKILIGKIGLGAAAIFGIGLALGAIQHEQTHNAAMAALAARQQAVPKVHIELVTVTTTPRDLSLPGTISPVESATIFARQSGYVAERRVDIGSRVKAGDLLATIAAPEIDDQLTQARAQLTQMRAALDQAKAGRALATANESRTAALVAQGWQSKQQGDTDRANLQTQAAGVTVAEANIAAQQAQVARLEWRVISARCAATSTKRNRAASCRS